MIKTPTLLIDTDKCKKNILAMTEKAKNNNLLFRPHFKTHQSIEIGRWFKEFGVEKITVSSVKMANYFAKDGWNDITVAFPVNILEIENINSLASEIKLNLLVESIEAINFLVKEIKYPINFFIKINTGYNRAGILPSNTILIDKILTIINKNNLLKFTGFLTHAGQAYSAKNKAEISQIHFSTTKQISELKNLYISQYPNIIASIGDTPTCSIMNDFENIDEIRPGNFVFYDVMQYELGSCDIEQIAVAVACPVVAIHKKTNELIIYGGGVHFSKEAVTNKKYGEYFGIVVSNDNWSKKIENVYLKKLSQEHGTIQGTSKFINSCKIGDIITTLPVHSCMTANSYNQYYTIQKKLIKKS